MDAAQTPATPRFIAPDRATPRTIGVLNIVLGILLTLFVLGLGLMQAGKAFAAGLQNRLQASVSPPGGRGAPAEIDIAKVMGVSDDPRIVGYHVIAVATGLLLNVMLIVAGVRLVGSPPRGRAFTQWLCGLKIARLVLVEGFYVLAVVPLVAQMQEEWMQSMSSQSPPGAGGPPSPAGTLGATYAVLYTMTGLAFMLLGAIYPAIVLWVFTRPAVKAAFGPPLAVADQSGGHRAT